MSVLIDTNILLRLAEPAHLQHDSAHEAVKRLIARHETLAIVPQNLYEFWVASTRPLDRNGLGFTTAAAKEEMAKVEQLFELLDDEREILPNWRLLVLQHDVKGKAAHDTRLVAAMAVHGVSSLLTFNKPDFLRYETISVVTPEEVLAS
jgi:predicted nucleic acid-binding protein